MKLNVFLFLPFPYERAGETNVAICINRYETESFAILHLFFVKSGNSFPPKFKAVKPFDNLC